MPVPPADMGSGPKVWGMICAASRAVPRTGIFGILAVSPGPGDTGSLTGGNAGAADRSGGKLPVMCTCTCERREREREREK